MKPLLPLLAVVLFPALSVSAADDGITWLVSYDGKALPDQSWTAVGQPKATIEAEGLRSLGGQTWAPIPGLDQLETTPLPMVRRSDGRILGASRWTWSRPDGSLTGKTVHLDPTATEFTMADSRIVLPPEFMPEKRGDVVVCERHIWNDDDGGVTMVVWSRMSVKRPDGRNNTERWSHLVRSTDEGKTWTCFSTIGPGGEPAVVRLSATEQTAVIRGDRHSQIFGGGSSCGGMWRHRAKPGLA